METMAQKHRTLQELSEEISEGLDMLNGSLWALNAVLTGDQIPSGPRNPDNAPPCILETMTQNAAALGQAIMLVNRIRASVMA